MNVDQIKDVEKLSHKILVTYYLFDILYIDGRNLQSLSFLERWRNLSDVIIQTNNNNNRIRISDFIDVRGIDIFQRIKSMNLDALLKRTNTVNLYKEQASLLAKD